MKVFILPRPRDLIDGVNSDHKSGETQSFQSTWTSDVLQVVRSLKKTEFWLSDVYDREGELARLHPDNDHVREKIRQQLQILRDEGIIEFLGDGHYRLT